MTDIFTRPLVTAHLPAVTRIYNDAVANTTATWVTKPASLEDRRAWWQERLGDGFPTLSAVLDDQCIGYASYGRFRAGPGYRFTRELSIYVDTAHRGKGVASRLMEALEAQARQDGVHVLVGGLEAGNAASLALHVKHGYTEVARMPQVGRKFERWLDLVLVQKVLD